MKYPTQYFVEKVKKKCLEKNYTFLGFSDLWQGNRTRLRLRCNICGNEWNSTTFSNFVNKSQGCPNCKKLRLSEIHSLNEEDVIARIKGLCSSRNYEFRGFCNEENRYIGCDTKLILKCNICGNEWNSTTYDHFINGGIGCPSCKNKKISETLIDSLDSVIRKAKEVHGDRYDYSLLAEYKGQNVRYPIVCKEHGVFLMDFSHHIYARRGCPRCASSVLENEVEQWLIDNCIEYARHKKLGLQHIDFFIPSKNIAIECQGKQHFKPIDFFGGEEEFKIITERDERKRRRCKELGYDLLYFISTEVMKDVPNEISDNYLIFTDVKSLGEYILKRGLVF